MIGSLVHLARNARAGFILAREGALALVDPNVLPPAGRAALRVARLIERRGAGDGAARLSAALTRLGPSYVKFGQFLATRPDIVGVAAARDLERLQDRMSPFPRAQAWARLGARGNRRAKPVPSGLCRRTRDVSRSQCHKMSRRAGTAAPADRF